MTSHNGTDDDAKKLNTRFTAFMVSNFGLLHLMQIPSVRTVIRNELNKIGWSVSNAKKIDLELKQTFEHLFFKAISNE
jgi:hypothetical protein